MENIQRLDLIFVLRRDNLNYPSLNNALFSHYKESLIYSLEAKVTYNLSVHFYFFSSNNNVFTFKNINFINHDTASREDLYGFLYENAYSIWCSNNNILGSKNISLNLIGILVDSSLTSHGYDFDGIYIG